VKVAAPWIIAALVGAGLLLSSCATTYPFQWYGLKAASYEGKLQGKTPEEDLPLSACQEDPQRPGKCVVYLVDEHARLQSKYFELEESLKACEEGKP
jgi:hypothetical protein